MNPYIELVLGVVIIAAAVWAIVRQVDVRLALLVAAFALGILGQDVPAIVQSNERDALAFTNAAIRWGAHAQTPQHARTEEAVE